MTLSQLQPYTRLLLSGALIFAVLAAVAGASSALLQTNTATAEGISISSATPDILRIGPDEDGNEIVDDPNDYATTLSGFASDGLVPGEEETFPFMLRNISDNDIDLHLFADIAAQTYSDLSASPTPSPLTSGQTDIDTKLNVKFFCNVKGGSTNDGSTVEKTLSSWSTTVTPLNAQFNEGGTAILEPAGSGKDQAGCTMTVRLDETATDGNHNASFDALFTGRQVPVPSPSP
jgi:hypothetical protein